MHSINCLNKYFCLVAKTLFPLKVPHCQPALGAFLCYLYHNNFEVFTLKHIIQLGSQKLGPASSGKCCALIFGTRIAGGISLSKSKGLSSIGHSVDVVVLTALYLSDVRTALMAGNHRLCGFTHLVFVPRELESLEVIVLPNKPS